MKYLLLSWATLLLTGTMVAQNPMLHNNDVCVQVTGDGMFLVVIGDVEQVSPNRPDVQNSLGGDVGAGLFVSGDISVLPGGANLLKAGNQMGVVLDGGAQHLSGGDASDDSGFLNFDDLLVLGAGDKTFTGDILLAGQLGFVNFQDILSQGFTIVAQDDVFSSDDVGIIPAGVGRERVDARFQDAAGFEGRYNYQSVATPGYFDEPRDIGGAGFLLRQADLITFELDRWHQPRTVAPGVESLPLRYVFSGDVSAPADVTIRHELVNTDAVNVDDLTLWYRQGGEWFNLGADEVTGSRITKNNIDGAILQAGAEFVTAPCPAPVVSLDVPVQSALCQFQPNTLAVLDPGGDFTYEWSTGETSRTIEILPTELAPLAYGVTVTDGSRCFRSFELPLTVIPTPGVNIDLGVTTQDTVTLCQDGTLTLAPTVTNTTLFDGTPGTVEYFWSTGETTETITLTGDGSSLVDTITLSVLVTNFAGSAAGCERLDTIYIRNEALPGFDLGDDRNFCDGTTSTTLTTGIADPSGLSIVWTLPDATTFTGPELNASQSGFYTANVNNGTCTVSDNIRVLFSNLGGTGVAVGPPCHPDDFDPGASQSGTLEITLTGGFAPFSWFVPESGLNGQSGEPTFTISSTFPEPEIMANTDYTVEITDGAGCFIVIGPLRFDPPQRLDVTPVIQDDQCGTGDGSVSVTTTGGTAPYTYAWSNGVMGENVAAITGLLAGSYDLTVTDINFCQRVFTGFPVGGSSTGAPLALTAAFSSIDCPGETTMVTLSGSGGNEGYTYSADGIDFNDVTVYELAAGSYTFVVRDAAGCQEIRTVELDDGNGPEVPTVTVLNPLQCFGDATDVSLDAGQQQQQVQYSLDNSTYIFEPFFMGLGAGDYRLYVRNGAGCVDSLDFMIDGPEELLVDAATTVTDDDCGLGEGAINLVVSGGTGVLSYAWDTPAANNGCCPDDLFAGTYNVTVTDENGCTLETNVTVGGAAGAMQVIGEAGTDPTCSDVPDGTISITLAGGTPPYRYELNGMAPQAITGNELILNNLSDGDYSFLLIDNNGCTVSTSLTLTAPPEIELLLVGVQPAGCDNVATGAIDLTIGGPDDLSAVWDDGPTTVDRSGLVAGTYTVTVFRTEYPACSSTLTVTVAQLASPELSFTVSPDDCLDATGSIAVSATGGSGLLAYDWADGATGANRTDLAAGNYTVTVTDENACTDEATVTVGGPAAPLDLGTTVNSVTCFGAGDGSISVAATGGNGGYAYSWSTGAVGTEITDLEPGEYGVTVSDAAGCLLEDLFTVTSPEELTAVAQITDVVLTGSASGAIDVTVSGGTEPYGYFWDVAGQPLAETEDLTDISAGIYNLVVVDANGCVYEQTYVVSEPSVLGITITEETAVSCFAGADGSLSAQVTGGDGSYTFSWLLAGAEIGTTATITNLVAGTYVLTMTDGVGNTAAETYTLTDPAELVVVPTQTDPSCADLDDGSVSLAVSGGTGSYTYAWADGPTDAERTFLAPGTYFVTVTDANGCMASPAPQTLTAPAPLALVASVEGISAPGTADGGIDLTVTGGTPGYDYAWNTGAETEDLVNLEPAEYSVTVTDVNACTGTAVYTVPGSSQLVVVAELANESCPETADGAITVAVAGGEGDYTFTWADGAFGAVRDNLAPGEYTVTVSDPAATDFTATYTITAADPVAFDLTVLDIDCAGNANGSITWTSGTNTGTLLNLSAGAYAVTITDDRSCQVVIDTVIREPDPLTLAAASTPVSAEGGNDGAVDLMVSGGTEPYGFAWSPGGEITEDLDNLAAGTYTVTVTDARFCTEELSVTVDEPSAIVLSGTVTDVRCNGEANGAIDLIAAGGQGFLSFAWTDGPTDEDRENLTAGAYRVIVTDLSGNRDSLDFTVGQPTALLANETVMPPSCAGDADGSVTLAPSGGNGGYTFTWADGDFGGERPDLPAGEYAVTITDQAGCVLALPLTLEDPEPLALVFSLDQPGCGAAATGTVDLTVTGGTPDYDYAWATGQISEDLANVAAGVYTVTVTDVNGCVRDSTVELTPAGEISLAATISDPACSGEATGTIALAVTPDEGDLTYAWSDGQSTATATGLNAGDYGVTVTSAAGCSVDSVFTLTAPDALVANVSTAAAGCSPNQGGGALAIPSGGTPGYTYAWSTNATMAMVADLAAGTYAVTVTDDNGCTASATATIMEADADLEVHFLAATPVDAGQQIQFVDVTFPAPQALFWAFNDPAASTSTEPNPVFAYPNNEAEDVTVYPAALTATSLFCEDQLIKDITVINLDGRVAPGDPDVVRPVYANLENIALYPNPTPDFAEITVTLNLAADITISLVDANGRVLTERELSGADRYDWVLDVSRLPAAVYFVRVATDYGVSTRKLVVD